jgi:chromosome segregation ATPase
MSSFDTGNESDLTVEIERINVHSKIIGSFKSETSNKCIGSSNTSKTQNVCNNVMVPKAALDMAHEELHHLRAIQARLERELAEAVKGNSRIDAGQHPATVPRAELDRAMSEMAGLRRNLDALREEALAAASASAAAHARAEQSQREARQTAAELERLRRIAAEPQAIAEEARAAIRRLTARQDLLESALQARGRSLPLLLPCTPAIPWTTQNQRHDGEGMHAWGVRVESRPGVGVGGMGMGGGEPVPPEDVLHGLSP